MVDKARRFQVVIQDHESGAKAEASAEHPDTALEMARGLLRRVMMEKEVSVPDLDEALMDALKVV